MSARRPTAPPRRATAAPRALVPAAQPSVWVSIAAGLAALALTLPFVPDLAGGKDAPEFTLVLARFAAAHPTGYPLYTLAGGAFVHVLHALGAHWAWAANAWSAVGGALAVALLHALAARWLAREGAPAAQANVGGLLPAAALATHPLWTAATTQAEVHSWHVAWTLGAALCALALLTPRAAAPAAKRHAAVLEPLAWGALVGLGLAHHVTSVLVSGPLTLAVAIAAARARRWHRGSIVLVAAGAAVPLLGYGFIAWRAFHPAAGQWDALAPSWPSILAHVTGAQYRVYVGGFAPVAGERALLWREVFPWLAVTLPATALWALLARGTPRALRLGVAGAVAATLAFVAGYGVHDPAAYFLPPLALSLAVLPALVARWAGARRAAGPIAAAAALLLVVEAVLGARACAERNREYRATDAHVRRLWHALPAPRGFVLWNDDQIALLHDDQLLANAQPGIELVYPAELTQDWARARFVARHGFDPISATDVAAAVANVHPQDRDQMAALVAGVIALRINAHSPLPVMMFLPDRDTVLALPKGAAADSLAAPGAAAAN